MHRHGCPAKIQLDGGRPYVSNAVLRFFISFNIEHQITAVYHPQSNGKAERAIKTIKNIVGRLLLDSFSDCTRTLQLAVGAYRFVPHQSTGFSPFMLLYRQEALMPEELQQLKRKISVSYEKKLTDHIEKIIKLYKLAINKNWQH